MSKGPGKVMRLVSETLAAHPDTRFTYATLAKLVYPGEPITRPKLVAIGRAVRKLEAAQALSPGKWTDYSLPERRNFKTVRAFNPQPDA
jgi:hypothetical protein